jgi:hypothetical protein
MAGIGATRTYALVKEFLRTYGHRIHALEMNGLRSWQENLGAVSLAKESDHPVVAGGDRHGLEPNATINLTRAATFKEFATEIRVERSSDIAVLPQYKEPLAFRHLLPRGTPCANTRNLLISSAGRPAFLSFVTTVSSALFPPFGKKERRAGSTHA